MVLKRSSITSVIFYLITTVFVLLLSACRSNNLGQAPSTGLTAEMPPLFSPLAGLPLPHPGRAMHAGSWDRTGGNHDYITVAPGQTVTLLDYKGAGIIHRFWMTLSPDDTRTLSQVILRMYWDNQTNASVVCPLGASFGVGFGEQKDYISLPLSETSGGFNCYWPMPFQRHARWTLENRSDETIRSFYYNVDFTAYHSLPADLEEFHACWRREDPTNPHCNYTILEARGEGTYVGTALFMQGLNMGKNKLAFLEGDPMIYIDQPNPYPLAPPHWKHPEPVPQINGTGTEDYFGGGWYFRNGPYSAPYSGCVIKDEKNSRVSAYRWNIEDAIPFHKHIRVTIEHGSRDSVKADYSSVAYFYLQAPMSHLLRCQRTRVICCPARLCSTKEEFNEPCEWNGSRGRGKGYLPEDWDEVGALFTGPCGVGFNNCDCYLESWSPLKGQTVQSGLPYMGKSVEHINNASCVVPAPRGTRASDHAPSRAAVSGARLQQIALRRKLRQLFKEGVCGAGLQRMVLSRCKHIAYWNRPYRYNGVGDCYGYCRQVWNAILADGKEHTEDYYPHKYDKKRWIDLKGGIPVDTFPDTNWVYFSNPRLLVPGDLLATDQGHFWGPNWHGGIYAGQGENWDCSTHNGLDGAYQRPLFSGFHYYYQPLHGLLLGNASTSIPSAWR